MTPAAFTLEPIGTIRTPYTDTKQIPRGRGAQHEAEGVLEIRADLADGLVDIEGFSHLYVLWIFHRADGMSLTAHPPNDDRPHGVFATRSPRRPNPIGLTVVRLLRREGTRLVVRGVDMLDGTPLVDIKPYMSSIPPAELRRGWLADAEARDAGDDRDARSARA
jgi:tRNA-Thr(GGU) m(6)t(6)A37 methyltransferase TsaA